jgi:hypothetical protein
MTWHDVATRELIIRRMTRQARHFLDMLWAAGREKDPRVAACPWACTTDSKPHDAID